MRSIRLRASWRVPHHATKVCACGARCHRRLQYCAVGSAADRLNHLQFLTIRQFLSLVFAALVSLLLVLALWL